MKLKRSRRRRKRNSTGRAPRLLRVIFADDVTVSAVVPLPPSGGETQYTGLLGEEADYGGSS